MILHSITVLTMRIRYANIYTVFLQVLFAKKMYIFSINILYPPINSNSFKIRISNNPNVFLNSLLTDSTSLTSMSIIVTNNYKSFT